MLRNTKRVFIVYVFIVIAALLISSKVSIPQILFPNNDDSISSLNNGWQYRWEDSNESVGVGLPSMVHGGSKDSVLWITNTFPMKEYDNASLLLRTSQQYVSVYIDNELIYHYGMDQGHKDYILPGSSWHLVNLPQFYEGKRIEISLQSPYQKYSGHINEIYIGSESSLILHIVFQYGSILVISFIIVLVGVLLILLYFVIKANEDKFKNVLYLGVGSILSGIWIASESKMIQLLINHPVLIFYMACISLFLLPIPLLQFLLSTYKPRNSNLLRGNIWIFSIFFIVITVLQIFSKGSFLNFMAFYHLLLLSCFITLMYISIREIVGGNRSIRLFFIGCIMLCVFAIVDMFGFYFSDIPGLNAQGYLQFAILLFVILLSVSLGHYILEILNAQERNKVYQKLAYTDLLTGLKNRTAFEEKIGELDHSLEEFNHISLVIFDLNNLKQINDTLGHQEGDHYILSASRLILDSFSDIGEIYRIGGDEFVVVIQEYGEWIVEERLLNFDKSVNDYNHQKVHVNVGVAYGMASVSKNEDANLNSVFIRADQEMYKCKKRQKQSSGLTEVVRY